MPMPMLATGKYPRINLEGIEVTEETDDPSMPKKEPGMTPKKNPMRLPPGMGADKMRKPPMPPPNGEAGGPRPAAEQKNDEMA